MHSLEEALEKILKAACPLESVSVPLLQSLGAYLAEDIYADIDIPPFDNSAVDGYAVRSADTAGATPNSPVVLQEIAEILAGGAPGAAVSPGKACRIMTGAPMPPGADAVVMIEDVRSYPGTGQAQPNAAILEAAVPEQHVRRAGDDLKVGTRVLESGTRIRPAEIAMLATMGRAIVTVHRSPRVAVFSTGDELIEIGDGTVPPIGKIRDSNKYTLAAMVEDAGAVVHSIDQLPDNPEATETALRAASDPNTGADVILTAGGVSMGDRDYVRPAVEKLGVLALWKVAIKPGKPLAFGKIGNTIVFGLPGNPISAIVTFELFARPALKRMAGAGAKNMFRTRVSSRLNETIPHSPGRREFVRTVTVWNGDHFESETAGKQGSGMLASAAASNSFLIVPEESSGLEVGDLADVLLID